MVKFGRHNSFANATPFPRLKFSKQGPTINWELFCLFVEKSKKTTVTEGCTKILTKVSAPPLHQNQREIKRFQSIYSVLINRRFRLIYILHSASMN